jgi:hypothetical protein
MANLNIGQAAALSPVTNFNLTDSLMKGAQFGMREGAAEAKALAARMKKEKIMSLDMSGIHPTLRKEAEDIVYNTTALQKIASDSGQSPMVPFTLGQFQLRGVQARSQRRIDLEKSDPNKYLMDQDAMTAFSKGDASEAKKILEKKGYDPELISALDPENVSFLPEKINIAEQLKKDYDPNTKAGLYVKKGEAVDMGKGQYYQTFVLNPKAAEKAAMSIATNQNARLTIMKERPEEYQEELTKELAKTPNEPALAKFRAVQNIIQNPDNPFLPSEKIEVTPSKGSNFNFNMGGGEPKYESGFLGPTQLAVKGDISLGSFTGKKEFTFDSEAYILDPQKVGIPKASLRNFDGTTPKTSIGVSDVTSANATSLPINKSNVTIHIDTFSKGSDGITRPLKIDIKPGQIIDPMLIQNGFVDNHKDKIKFVPAALYTGKSKDASGTEITKSYYSPLFRGARNIYSDSDVKAGMLGQTISHLQALSDEKNKEYGLGESQKPATKAGAAVKQSGGAPRPKK